jgi:OOP family OmpA-OmpF porin
VAVIIGGLILRSRMRWNAAVARLRAEPGIVVTEAERGWGGWRFAGLRDPLAPDPGVVLAGLGADTAGIEQRWEPYLSLRPEMVLARARRALAPPPSVRLSLSGDTIQAAGTAPLAWVTQSRNTALLPGAAVLDLGRVTPEIPRALTQLKEAIERERVLFEVGSSRLDARGRSAIGRSAAAFGRLKAGGDAIGARATVVLVGRTDATGSDSANQALSRLRAVAVLRELAARGVPRSAMKLEAVGTSRPLESADSSRRSGINRSVSFQVGLDVNSGRGASR